MSMAADREAAALPTGEPLSPRRPPRRFFPDLLAIEALVALAMLGVLVALALLTSAPLEEEASREAAGYTPRPEWYFLWFFQLLRYFQGRLEVIGTVFVPLLGIVLLVAVPLLDRRPPKTTRILGRTRPLRMAPRVIVLVVGAALLTLTVAAAMAKDGESISAPAPVPEWPPQSRTHDAVRPMPLSMDFDEAARGSDVRLA